MKIRSGDQIRAHTARAKRPEVKSGGFQELLHTRLDDIHPESGRDQPDETPEHSGSRLEIIEHAALMLDEALEQIQQNGQPSEEIAHALEALRDRLKQTFPDTDKLEDADAIIAVETSRLQSWKF